MGISLSPIFVKRNTPSPLLENSTGKLKETWRPDEIAIGRRKTRRERWIDLSRSRPCFSVQPRDSAAPGTAAAESALPLVVQRLRSGLGYFIILSESAMEREVKWGRMNVGVRSVRITNPSRD